MIEVPGTIHLPYQVNRVYAEGTKSFHWEKSFAGISIVPEDDLIALGGMVRIVFETPKLPLLSRLPPLECNTTVVECVPNERVHLLGNAARIGTMGLSFDLREESEETAVDYLFEGNFKELGFKKHVVERTLDLPLRFAIGGFAKMLAGSIDDVLRPPNQAAA